MLQVPLLPLYTRGAGLHDGVLVGYGIGVLVGYNCTSSAQGRLDSIPIPIEASCSLAQQVVRVYPVWSSRSGPPSVRVAVLGYRVDTGVTSSTVITKKQLIRSNLMGLAAYVR